MLTRFADAYMRHLGEMSYWFLTMDAFERRLDNISSPKKIYEHALRKGVIAVNVRTKPPRYTTTIYGTLHGSPWMHNWDPEFRSGSHIKVNCKGRKYLVSQSPQLNISRFEISSQKKKKWWYLKLQVLLQYADGLAQLEAHSP